MHQMSHGMRATGRKCWDWIGWLETSIGKKSFTHSAHEKSILFSIQLSRLHVSWEKRHSIEINSGVVLYWPTIIGIIVFFRDSHKILFILKLFLSMSEWNYNSQWSRFSNHFIHSILFYRLIFLRSILLQRIFFKIINFCFQVLNFM